ncbi:MAG: hypothetical protein GXX85_00480 [Ignavibacteria bacterium]|nr:hypothetical protein [Ignavibacteria bacterium]
MLTDSDYQHIKELKSILKNKYGSLITKILCYGSRVSTQNQNTDFDIAIITSQKLKWEKEDEISDVLFYYGLQNDILFDEKYFSEKEFTEIYSSMPFISEIKKYGIAI